MRSYIKTMRVHLRTGILLLHDLKMSDSKSIEEGMAAADKLIKHQREFQISGVEDRHPDIIVGNPMLDQFRHCKHQGMRGIVFG